MPDEHGDEETYLAARAEQLAARMESEGVSRKKLLQLVGGALPLRAGGKPLAADAPAAERAEGSPIRKPLPPEWFVPFGTNAETRWDSLADVGYEVPNERFFVRNHTATPLIDPATSTLSPTARMAETEMFSSSMSSSSSVQSRSIPAWPR